MVNSIASETHFLSVVIKRGSMKNRSVLGLTMAVGFAVLMVVSAIVVSQAAQATSLPMLSTWVCRDGDYNLSIVVTQGGRAVNFDICSFNECEGPMTKRGTYNGLNGGNYYYQLPDPNQNEQLLVRFAGEVINGEVAVLSVDKSVDGTTVQAFTGCRKK